MLRNRASLRRSTQHAARGARPDLIEIPTMTTQTIQPGDTVRLKASVRRSTLQIEGRENHRTAVVQSRLTDIEGGLFLQRDLHGYRYWNEADVERVDA